MLDRCLRLTFRDFSTYFLIVAAVVLPLEFAYGAVFSDVIAVRELQPEIERLPEGARLLDVTRERLTLARRARAALNVVQLLLLPWMAGATRRALEAADRGRVPTLPRSFGRPGLSPLRGRDATRARLRHFGTLLATFAVAAGVGLLVRYLGELVIEPSQGPGSWALVAAAETAARAAGAPFFLVAWAETGRVEEGEAEPAPNVY